MRVFPLNVERTTNASGANSANTCLHAPQGGRNSSQSDVMAMALNRACPYDRALNTAILSAQIVREYELFSTLQPE